MVHLIILEKKKFVCLFICFNYHGSVHMRSVELNRNFVDQGKYILIL